MQEHSGQNQKASLVKWNCWKVQFRCLRKSWWNKFYKKPLWKKAKTTKNTKDKYFMDQAANFLQGRQNRKDNSDQIFFKKATTDWTPIKYLNVLHHNRMQKWLQHFFLNKLQKYYKLPILGTLDITGHFHQKW